MSTTYHKKIEQTQSKRQKRHAKQICMIATDLPRLAPTMGTTPPRKKNLTE
jgi:hypothetical protein